MVLLPAVMHLLGERAWWRRRGKDTRSRRRSASKSPSLSAAPHRE
jgi:hypothetical protein